MRVLLVEDDARMAESAEKFLRNAGFADDYLVKPYALGEHISHHAGDDNYHDGEVPLVETMRGAGYRIVHAPEPHARWCVRRLLSTARRNSRSSISWGRWRFPIATFTSSDPAARSSCRPRT